MKHNKIVFLDVDGVINIAKDRYHHFNQDCLFQLERIIKETDAKIVVSSSWRTGNQDLTKQALMESGFTQFLADQIVGETVRNWKYVTKGSHLELCRGNEIATYVSRSLRYPWHEYPEMDQQYRINKPDGSFERMRSNKAGVDFSYVILDDDSDMLLCQKDFFVQTFEPGGLSEEAANKAIQILNQIDKNGRA